jgi:hypothetical protein
VCGCREYDEDWQKVIIAASSKFTSQTLPALEAATTELEERITHYYTTALDKFANLLVYFDDNGEC